MLQACSQWAEQWYDATLDRVSLVLMTRKRVASVLKRGKLKYCTYTESKGGVWKSYGGCGTERNKSRRGMKKSWKGQRATSNSDFMYFVAETTTRIEFYRRQRSWIMRVQAVRRYPL
jgi:hypothetical protein